MSSDAEKLQAALDKVPPDVLVQVIEHVNELDLDKVSHAKRLEVALENVRMYYGKILPAMLASEEPRIQEVVDMLVDSCLVEKNFEEGMLYFAEQVHGRGLEIEIDPERFRGWVEKLANLRLYRKVLHAMGLGAFEDELIRVEIEKTIAPLRNGPAPVAPPKGKSK